MMRVLCFFMLGFVAVGATPAQAQAAISDEKLAIEEIVVTAQRREENTQSAAVALSVLSGEQISKAAVSKPADLTHLVPALQVSANTAPFSVFYLRGVGNFTGNSLSDPAVAFNVNDVYVGRPSSTNGFFYDLERVEVLKGPQGILYGRNATGGAINLVPRPPQLEQHERGISFEFGEYDALRLDGAVNVPIGRTAALRAAASRVRHGGYMKDGMDDQDDWAARTSLLVMPRSNVSVSVVADYFSQRGRGPGSTPVALDPDHRISVSSPQGRQFYESQRISIAGRNFNALPATQQLDNEFWGLSARIDWELPSGVLTVVPAWRESQLDVVGTSTGMTLTNVEDDRQHSVELRFASNIEQRWSYLLGTFYYDESSASLPFVVNNQYNISVQHPRSETRSSAVFGNVTYSITDSLRATAGTQYTRDRKTFDGTFESFVKLCLPIPTAVCPGAERFPADLLTPPYPFPDGATEFALPNADGTLVRGFLISANESESFANTTWRIGFDWDMAEQHLLFASLETGFKSGGFFFSNDSQVYDPEEITAITLGSKSRFLDQRLQLNAEIYHWRYDDQQISTVTVDSRGASNLRTRNVGQATIRGAEVDLRWLAAPGWLLGLNAQYLDATYDSFEYSAPAGAPPLTGCRIANGPASDYTVDCSGRRAPYAPETTVNVSAEYTMSLRGGSTIVASGRAHHQTTMLTGQDFTPDEYQPGYWWIDVATAYRFNDDAWEITAFANNVTDETVIAHTFQPPFGRFVVGTIRPPRTVGLRLGVSF